MTENVTKIQYRDKEIILVATAHVSQTSVDLVKETIDAERPDSVCVELDEGRYKAIQDPQAWERTNVVDIIRQKRVGFMIAQLFLSAYQKRMAKKLGTNVGGEMIQGIVSAKEIGAELVLADRNIQITLTRLWRLLKLREKMKLFLGFILGEDEEDDDEKELTEEEILKLLDKDMLESVLGDVKEEFPVIAQVLISERDQYLANKIKNASGPKVLAVLGGAHVPGVTEEINKEQDMEKINTVPYKKSWGKYFIWIIPVIFVGLLAYSFSQGIDTGMHNLALWWFWNGGLAALFTLLVLGHPLSILTAFMLAPITTVIPFLASGWFAGLVEASIRKPKVDDMQRVAEDIYSIKGWYKNRFLKVLAVVMFANIGSTIGTFVSGGAILQNLFG